MSEWALEVREEELVSVASYNGTCDVMVRCVCLQLSGWEACMNTSRLFME